MAQMVEHFPSKQGTLNSIPSTEKKKKSPNIIQNV
jgi:hypothetical protein